MLFSTISLRFPILSLEYVGYRGPPDCSVYGVVYQMDSRCLNCWAGYQLDSLCFVLLVALKKVDWVAVVTILISFDRATSVTLNSKTRAQAVVKMGTEVDMCLRIVLEDGERDPYHQNQVVHCVVHCVVLCVVHCVVLKEAAFCGIAANTHLKYNCCAIGRNHHHFHCHSHQTNYQAHYSNNHPHHFCSHCHGHEYRADHLVCPVNNCSNATREASSFFSSHNPASILVHHGQRDNSNHGHTSLI